MVNVMRNAIGSMVDIMVESMATFAPNANSYRRYGRNSYVPSAPNWGPNHRDPALRIPLSSPENTRVEHRSCLTDVAPRQICCRKPVPQGRYLMDGSVDCSEAGNRLSCVAD